MRPSALCLRFRGEVLAKAVVIVALAGSPELIRAEDFTRDQRLVLACYQLRVDRVVRYLRDGADVNACYGEDSGESDPFFDRWEGGTFLGTEDWTPLIAVAHARDYPDPAVELGKVWKNLDRSRALRKQIPRETIEKRSRDAMTIVRILLSHGCDVNRQDYRGATALYVAARQEKLQMAKTLLEFGANPNTKTGIYLDGAGDLTPLHVACGSPELMQLLLDHGADPSAQDTDGKTPADWLALENDGALELVVSAQGAHIRPRAQGSCQRAKLSIGPATRWRRDPGDPEKGILPSGSFEFEQ